MGSFVSVPCNGCTVCCRHGGRVFLRLDKGDNKQFYKTREAFDSTVNEMGLYIEQKPDGSCIYLGEHGCTIHTMAPFACRMFDCREYWKRMKRQERRKKLRDGDTILQAAETLLQRG